MWLVCSVVLVWFVCEWLFLFLIFVVGGRVVSCMLWGDWRSWVVFFWVGVLIFEFDIGELGSVFGCIVFRF